MSWISVVSVFFAGLLAGEELVVRYAVHPALARLDARGQITTRQALIVPLRVLAPALFFATLASAVVMLVVEPGPVRWGAIAALVIWLLSTALGTVPINIRVADWDPDAPPAGWERIITRWAAIDVVRSSSAILAFALLLLAAG
jgi:uncharacterized membrane protein